MSELNETEIRRRTDGSIDYDFYERRARLLRAREYQALIGTPWSKREGLFPGSSRKDISASNAAG